VFCESGSIYDINSLYPYMMLTLKYPYGKRILKGGELQGGM